MGRTACTEPQYLYSRAIPLLPLQAIRPVQSLSACTIELYLYSPYGPYGLYRASVPVQGCTLPFFTYKPGGVQPPQNSGCQKVTNTDPTNIMRHRSKISHRGDMAPRNCASLVQTLHAYNFYITYMRNGQNYALEMWTKTHTGLSVCETQNVLNFLFITTNFSFSTLRNLTKKFNSCMKTRTENSV
jgi:hypothetical protein